MSDYIEIRADLPEDVEDQLAEAFASVAILGVQIDPGSAGRIEVAVWVGAGNALDAHEVESILTALDSGATRVREQADRDWSAEWRKGLTAFEVGRLWWIDPHPERSTAAPNDRYRLAVEPCAAFGSGTHESTRLVLMELEDRDCRSLRVLDIGTGSGVLAIAAERLDSDYVVALDIDPIAAWEARTTVRRQSWRSRLPVIAGGTDCLGNTEFDLVLCNMIVSNFSPLLGDIRRLLAGNGTAVFSGVLVVERPEVEGILEKAGLTAVGFRELGEWTSILAVCSGSTL
jgi:ribosomal protein L11 methyltransferase